MESEWRQKETLKGITKGILVFPKVGENRRSEAGEESEQESVGFVLVGGRPATETPV